MKSHVTTKQGDAGQTRTLGGDIESKGSVVLECTGCVDALRAHLALLRLQILDEQPKDAERIGAFIFWLLHCCFLLGAEVNDPRRKHPEYRKAELSPVHLARLETEQQFLESRLELPRAFIVSASTRLAAQVDVVATVARTLERTLVRLKEAVPEFESDAILAFTNRLSDYLYILARYLEAGTHLNVDYSVLQDGYVRNRLPERPLDHEEEDHESQTRQRRDPRIVNKAGQQGQDDAEYE